MQTALPSSPCDVLIRAVTDPLLVLAKVVGLVPADSYDAAYDAIEELKPGFYQPASEVENYLRLHWVNLIPAGAAALAAVRWKGLPNADHEVQHFLAKIAEGRSVCRACSASGLARSTVYDRRKADPVFAAALLEAKARGDLYARQAIAD